MKKLIPLSDFVLEHLKPDNFVSSDVRKVINYTNLLKQPLKLEYFVPCDEDGSVLNQPFYEPTKRQYWMAERFAYNVAKEKVLFEGFKLSPQGISVQSFTSEGLLETQIPISEFKIYETIEDFMRFNENLTLTPSALKQIGVKE